MKDLNLRPPACEAGALPTELIVRSMQPTHLQDARQPPATRLAQGRRRTTRGALALLLLALAGLAACAETEPKPGAQAQPGASTQPQPPAAAWRYKVTPPGQFPIDVYLSPWAEGYVISAPGQAPIYLISDKKGGYILQRPGESASFVAPRPDGGWTILYPNQPATFLLKRGDGWILQAPGELPTLIVPQ